ncbi:hypothetical protein [Verrucosispora sp. WMMD573]|uniref:hypothetical protein n=1 Tax=Verrucosispora sp. WMMD573 TaxID=3015149 RepID=UPI00248BB46F|nr:hypothetical protein [Verrucosispora sp. WMMD573]WBB52447.1 hypothetical protein O7601_17830 [Verrucosispora sp. WMMD573]
MARDEPDAREVLLARVEARVARYADTLDSAHVLGPQAAAEAAALLAIVDRAEHLDAEVMLAVAYLHWVRADHVDAEAKEAEVAIAVPLFADLYTLDPGLLPPSLHAQLDEATGIRAYRSWEQTGDPQALDEAVGLLRTACTEGGGGPRRLSNLSSTLRQRFLLTGDRSDIDEAVVSAAEAVRRAESTDPNRGAWLSNQGSALLARFGHSGDPADLDTAVAALRAATAAAPGGVYLSNLAAALITRHTISADSGDLTAAQAAARAAVTGPGHDDQSLADATAVLCLVLTRGYDVSGDPNILAEAITAGEQAVRLGGGPEALTNLAVALVNRYLMTGFVADLDTAVDLGRQAAADSTAAGQAINLSNLADTLQLRFAAGAPSNVLDEAVDVAAKAVAVAGPDDPGQVTYLANLGAAHLTRHEITGHDDDLEAALAAARSAVDAAGPAHRARPLAETTLGLALLARYETDGAPADLDEAVLLARAAAAAETGVNDRISCLGNLYAALQQLFARDGEPALLDEAVNAAAEAARLAGGTAHAAVTQSNLSAAHGLRQEATGAPADVEAAVDAAQRAVVATSPGDRALAARYGNLSAARLARFTQFGALTDLDDAITAARQAVAVSTGPAVLATSRSGLAAALYHRFTVVQDCADLDEAVDAARASVAGSPKEAPERPGRRANLASVLMVRDRPDDLDEAIEQYQEAVAAVTGAPVLRAALQSNLAHALSRRYMLTGSAADLTAAISVGREALESAGSRPVPDRATYLVNLARALHLYAERTDDTAATSEALNLLAQAEAAAETPAEDRLTAAVERGRIAAVAGNCEQARAGYSAAARLLPEAAWTGLDRRSRERHLSRTTAIGADAAAWQLTAADIPAAIELLELGRSVLWTSLLDQRPDLSLLKHEHPELVRRLVEVGARRHLLH